MVCFYRLECKQNYIVCIGKSQSWKWKEIRYLWSKLCWLLTSSSVSDAWGGETTQWWSQYLTRQTSPSVSSEWIFYYNKRHNCFLFSNFRFNYPRDSRCEGQCWPESCMALRPETLTDTDQSLRATWELISEQMSQSAEGLHKTVENKEYLWRQVLGLLQFFAGNVKFCRFILKQREVCPFLWKSKDWCYVSKTSISTNINHWPTLSCRF